MLLMRTFYQPGSYRSGQIPEVELRELAGEGWILEFELDPAGLVKRAGLLETGNSGTTPHTFASLALFGSETPLAGLVRQEDKQVYHRDEKYQPDPQSQQAIIRE